MHCQPDPAPQSLSIIWMLCHSDYSNISILDCISAWYMHPLIGYWIMNRPSWLLLYSMYCQPYPAPQSFSIRRVIGHSYYLSIWILDSMSAWYVVPLIMYWIINRPSWMPLYANTQCTVSLIQHLSHWVLDGWLATPVTPAFQYLITCQPNPCIHRLCIGSWIGRLDYSYILILNAFSA